MGRPASPAGTALVLTRLLSPKRYQPAVQAEEVQIKSGPIREFNALASIRNLNNGPLGIFVIRLAIQLTAVANFSDSAPLLEEERDPRVLALIA